MAYGNSKIAQIMFTKYLDKHVLSRDDCHVTVTAIHPGVVRTDLHKSAFMHTVNIYRNVFHDYNKFHFCVNACQARFPYALSREQFTKFTINLGNSNFTVQSCFAFLGIVTESI
jgi:NAD(P)-dependent dehydrogenase (short-subunit alcohol dehydrogenase family)